MTDLNEIYKKLPLPKNQSSNSYSAKAIEGYENHRIAKNFSDYPSLLIFISDQNEDLFVANQNLYNIQVSHNLKCEIELNDEVSQNNFSVISYIGQNNDVKKLFLSTCQILVKSLGQKPSNKEIKLTVGKFIELFKAVKEIPRNSIQGLWCELLLIEQSSIPEKMIDGWHSIPEEKFDFSFGKLRLEVKSSVSESRTHLFSSRQLNPSKDTVIIISSVLVSVNVAGYSINDLLFKINRKLNNFPKQKEKLHFLVYSTLGIDIEKVNQIKYDYQLAKDSMNFYNAENIPKIEKDMIPNEISNLKYSCNLDSSKPYDIDIDKFLLSLI